jgi:hypothetical protein
MDGTRWPRNVLEWVPQERRERGRPRRGWREDTKEAMEARTSLKKIVIEGKSGDWGRRNGDSCKTILNRVKSNLRVQFYLLF